MPRALVLDVHSRAGLETLQSLGRHAIEVDVATDRKNCLAFYSRYVRRRLEQPPASSPSFDRWLAEIRAETYDLIVPSTEESLLVMRTLDPEDPLRRAAILPSNGSLDVALDKEETRKLALALGIRTPSSVLIARDSEPPACEAYPVVLKPVRSKIFVGGKAMTVAPLIARSPVERLVFLRQLLPHTAIQQQEYIRGSGFGVEVLCASGHPVWTFVHERLHEYPLTGGGSSYRRSKPPVDALVEPAIKLLSALEWHGVAMVEFKWEESSAPVLMEINPRLWGSLALGIDAGVDFPFGLLCLALGRPVPPQPRYRVHFYTRDITTDLEWQKENLTASHSDPLLMTRPRILSLLEMLRPLSGRENWDHFDWADLGITARIVRQTLTRVGRPIVARSANELRDRWLLGSCRVKLNRLSREKGEIRCILFICYGNICRSPLAQMLAQSLIADRHFASAGFHPEEGRRPPATIVEAARMLGADLDLHSSRLIDRAMVEQAHMILVMDTENLASMTQLFPEAAGRTLPLGIFHSPPRTTIRDPYGASLDRTAQIAADIRASVLGLRSWLQSV